MSASYSNPGMMDVPLQRAFYTDGARRLYLLNASFLRVQITLVALIKNIQKARRPQLPSLKRKQHQRSMMLEGARKNRPLFSGPTQTLKVAHSTLSVLTDTFAHGECITVLFYNAFVVFVLLEKLSYCLISLNQ